MDRNLRLVKMLLEDVETNTFVTSYGTNLHTSIEDTWGRYKREYGEEISYKTVEDHAYLCVEAGFIRDPDRSDLEDNEKGNLLNVVGLTWAGYDKLDELRNT